MASICDIYQSGKGNKAIPKALGHTRSYYPQVRKTINSGVTTQERPSKIRATVEEVMKESGTKS